MSRQVLPSFILFLNSLVYVADRDWLSRHYLLCSNYELGSTLVNNGGVWCATVVKQISLVVDCRACPSQGFRRVNAE